MARRGHGGRDRDTMEIAGKNALVTGGALRVGKSIALMLSEAGANVAFTYLTSEDEARDTADEITCAGVRSLAIRCDVSDWASVQSLARTVETELGGVDIIINSAGLFRRTPVPTEDVELWQRVTRASIDGTFYVCNALVPGMQTRGGGAIVNILDSAAWHPWLGFSAHSVAKAGMLALTRQFAVEFSPHIRTNAVAAGPVLPPEGMSSERHDEIASSTLLGRWGGPRDVVEAVRYLLTADYVIGEVLTVDGGERYGYARA
jgi:NAD(P)-dependent dehydrogenase (short-subunit alcohol dehydrogenase family)